LKRKSEKIVLTQGLKDEEVVRAWWALGASPTAESRLVPQRVERLRKRNKSIVYRLPSMGENGTDVIAKHCLRENALAERRAYEILERLPLATTRFYGYVGNGTDEFCWLFLEDAGGEPLNPEVPEQRELATRWLAALHATSSELEATSSLPERGPAHYRRHLRAAQRVLENVLQTMDLPADGRSVLRQLQVRLDTIAARWIDVEALCRAMPWALVHGDFAERNVRVRHREAHPELLAFDWEVAGWGFPGVDLGLVDLDVYHECARAVWPKLGRRKLESFAQLGSLLRGGVAAVHWEALKLDPRWLDNPLRNMEIYLQRIEEALRDLGWQAAAAGGPPRAGQDDVV